MCDMCFILSVKSQKNVLTGFLQANGLLTLPITKFVAKVW